MKNSALIWHDTGHETLYRDTLSPNCDVWLLLWLDERGITSYEAWKYQRWNVPRKLIMAGCLIQRFKDGTESDWQCFIRNWYWQFYKRN